eukprot:s1380_g3.t1
MKWLGLPAKEHFETSQQKSLYRCLEAGQREDGLVVGVRMRSCKEFGEVSKASEKPTQWQEHRSNESCRPFLQHPCPMFFRSTPKVNCRRIYIFIPNQAKRRCSCDDDKDGAILRRFCANHAQRQAKRAGTETQSGRLHQFCPVFPGSADSSQPKSFYRKSERRRREDVLVARILVGVASHVQREELCGGSVAATKPVVHPRQDICKLDSSAQYAAPEVLKCCAEIGLEVHTLGDFSWYAGPAVLKCCAEIGLEVDLLIGHSHGSLVVSSLASLFKRFGKECPVIFLDPRTTENQLWLSGGQAFSAPLLPVQVQDPRLRDLFKKKQRFYQEDVFDSSLPLKAADASFCSVDVMVMSFTCLLLAADSHSGTSP